MERKFIPRSDRFDLNLPVRFFPRSGMMNGHCTNVSETGMRAIFEKPVELWLAGELSILLEGTFIRISVVVARADGREAGLAFHAESEDDRRAIQMLAEYAKQQHQPEILIGVI